MGRARNELESFMTAAAEEIPDVDSEMTLSEPFERAEAAALQTLSRHRGPAGAIRRHLRGARQPAQDADVSSVLTGIFSMILGEPPPLDDAVMLNQILYAFGGHGLVEPLFPGAPVVMPEGAAAFGETLAVVARAGIFEVPDDISHAELVSAREFCRSLSSALTSIPIEALKHHLGGDATATFWQPDDPLKVTQMLTYFVKVSRICPLNSGHIIAAVQQQGWLSVP